MIRWLCVALVLALASVGGKARSEPVAATATAALAAAQQILATARAEAAQGCRRPSDTLVLIVCRDEIRIGFRTYYPGFSIRKDDGTFVGFEADVGRRIADFLGVKLVTVAVDPKNRIPMVDDRLIDLVIATMGHDSLRDREVTFIRPHYYMSQTVIVGARERQVADWKALGGQIVCLPLGSSSNILFIRHQIGVLTFDRPEQLLDALAFKECAFIVHDDTFFRKFLTDPAWSARFGIMFGFAPLPWGMAVADEHSTQLAALLTALSIAFHANGTFLELAKANDLDVTFLESQQRKWSEESCVTAAGVPAEACLLPIASDAPTGGSEATRGWGWSGIGIGLTLLRSQATFDLLMAGIGYSLALIVGSQLATVAFAVLLGRFMSTGPVLTRRAFVVVAATGQMAPLPLLLFFGYVIAGGITQYSGRVALLVAVLVLGFYNGCNAGRAIHDAFVSLQRRRDASGTSVTASESQSFWYALSIACTQIFAFLINAAKGSPAAGMIGVPEFLNVLTDLTAYSRERIGVYLILLIFYTSLVLLVILLLSRGQVWLERRTEHFR